MYGPIEKLISSQLQDSRYKIIHLEKIIKHLQLQLSITNSILENTKHTRNTLNQQHKLLKDGVDTILKSTNDNNREDIDRDTFIDYSFTQDTYLEEAVHNIQDKQLISSSSHHDYTNLLLSGTQPDKHIQYDDKGDGEKELGTDDENKGDSDCNYEEGSVKSTTTIRRKRNLKHKQDQDKDKDKDNKLSPILISHSRTPTRNPPSIKQRHLTSKNKNKRKLVEVQRDPNRDSGSRSGSDSDSEWKCNSNHKKQAINRLFDD